MKKAIKKIWTEALRSKKFKQGQYQLYNPTEESYCCLGVLCELYRQKFPKQSKWMGDTFTGNGDQWGCTAELPEYVRKWAGIDDDDEGTLVSLNDGDFEDGGFEAHHRINKPYDFDQIADCIDAYL